MRSNNLGCLYGVGVGTGNPELITLKALRILQSVPVIAYPASETGSSFARSIVAEFLQDNQIEVPIVVFFIPCGFGSILLFLFYFLCGCFEAF
ncbi:MAG: SAM-dependent methyltransferase, partial [Cyanobacteria bacterium J06628_3]